MEAKVKDGHTICLMIKIYPNGLLTPSIGRLQLGLFYEMFQNNCFSVFHYSSFHCVAAVRELHFLISFETVCLKTTAARTGLSKLSISVESLWTL